MKTTSMPKIEYHPQNDWEERILSLICNKNGQLKRSKPAAWSRQWRTNPDIGAAYYVWRNVAFYASPHAEHWCMPVLCDLYIQLPYDACRAYCKEVLDPLVDRIMDSIPKSKWHGVSRWAKALGAF